MRGWPCHSPLDSHEVYAPIDAKAKRHDLVLPNRFPLSNPLPCPRVPGFPSLHPRFPNSVPAPNRFRNESAGAELQHIPPSVVGRWYMELRFAYAFGSIFLQARRGGFSLGRGHAVNHIPHPRLSAMTVVCPSLLGHRFRLFPESFYVPPRERDDRGA